MKKVIPEQTLNTSWVCRSQLSFRSSRASAWGCDPESDSPTIPSSSSSPCQPGCPAPSPSGGPETDAKASDAADLRVTLPAPSVITSCCGLSGSQPSYGRSDPTPAGEHALLAARSPPVCLPAGTSVSPPFLLHLCSSALMGARAFFK